MSNYWKWLKEEERASESLSKCKYYCTNCRASKVIFDSDYAICHICGNKIYSKKGLEKLEKEKREKFKNNFAKAKGKMEE